MLQGSNTLPRAGQRNKLKQSPGLGTVDDSEIVITKKLTGGGSSVRIRIGGSARSPTEQVGWDDKGEFGDKYLCSVGRRGRRRRKPLRASGVGFCQWWEHDFLYHCFPIIVIMINNSIIIIITRLEVCWAAFSLIHPRKTRWIEQFFHHCHSL